MDERGQGNVNKIGQAAPVLEAGQALMETQTGKKHKLIVAARVVKAISTIGIVVVPVAAAVGAIIGYGGYSLVKKLWKKRL